MINVCTYLQIWRKAHILTIHPPFYLVPLFLFICTQRVCFAVCADHAFVITCSLFTKKEFDGRNVNNSWYVYIRGLMRLASERRYMRKCCLCICNIELSKYTDWHWVYLFLSSKTNKRLLSCDKRDPFSLASHYFQRVSRRELIQWYVRYRKNDII